MRVIAVATLKAFWNDHPQYQTPKDRRWRGTETC